MHADRPGDRPRLLYWYRTAPGIVLGRSPLDEDAIRNIEDQHPDIDFDWPAILALSEVMTPEEEAPAPRAQQQQQQRQGKRRRERDADASPRPSHEPRRDDAPAEASAMVDAAAGEKPETHEEAAVDHHHDDAEVEAAAESPQATVHGLLEELVGREISTRLRARYSEILARIHEHGGDAASRDGWVKRAQPLNPELWLTPDAILEGVRTADNLFETLRIELIHSSRE